jgi:hypothetical protein
MTRHIGGKGPGCAVEGCQRRARHAFCRQHWQGLPREVRRAVSRTRRSSGPERSAARRAADNVYNWRAERWNVSVPRVLREEGLVPGEGGLCLHVVPRNHLSAGTWLGVSSNAPGLLLLESVRVGGLEYLAFPVAVPTGFELDPIRAGTQLEVHIRNTSTADLRALLSMCGSMSVQARGSQWMHELRSWVRATKPWTNGRKQRRSNDRWPRLPGSFFLELAGKVAGRAYPLTPGSSSGTQDGI